jgi:hypothetical protein
VEKVIEVHVSTARVHGVHHQATTQTGFRIHACYIDYNHAANIGLYCRGIETQSATNASVRDQRRMLETDSKKCPELHPIEIRGKISNAAERC